MVLKGIAVFRYYIIHRNIYNQMKHATVLYQYRFSSERSNIINLALFSQYLSDSVDDGGQADIIYTEH